MKTYKIPVYWEMTGTIEIEADSLEEAVAAFDRDIDIIELPETSNYVLGSFDREEFEILEEINDNGISS